MLLLQGFSLNAELKWCVASSLLSW